MPGDSDIFAVVDLMPTVCDYLGVEPPEGLQGVSVRSLAEGRTSANSAEPRSGAWREDLLVETSLTVERGQGRALLVSSPGRESFPRPRA